MPKIEILTKAVAIAEGWTRVILDIRTSVMVYREDNFCMKCPLSHRDGVYTGTCDSKKGGCGCSIKAKTSQDQLPCPKGFWANNYVKPDEFNDFIDKNPI